MFLRKRNWLLLMVVGMLFMCGEKKTGYYFFRMKVLVVDKLQKITEYVLPPEKTVLNLISGQRQAETVFQLVHLGAFEALASSEKSLSCLEFVPNITEDGQNIVCRLAETGHVLGLLGKNSNQEYYLTETGKVLTKEHPYSLAEFAEVEMSTVYLQALRAGMALDNLEQNTVSGFQKATGFELFDYLRTNPKFEHTFDQALMKFSKVQDESILNDYTFQPNNMTLCDIGGGIGGFLTKFLLKYPKAHGILFDEFSQTQTSKTTIKNHHLEQRLSSIPGSFFEFPLPDELMQCDLFILKFILHDWSDKDSLIILHNLLDIHKKRLTKKTRILIADCLLNTDPTFLEKDKRMSDLTMLIQKPGARERTKQDFIHLFQSCCSPFLPDSPLNFVSLRSSISITEATLLPLSSSNAFSTAPNSSDSCTS